MTIRKITPYLFILPALVGLTLFKVYPIMIAFWKSFFEMAFLTGGLKFVGLGNYVSLMNDPIFWKSLKVTLWFNFMIIPVVGAGAFALAVLLNKRIAGITFFRSVQFIPIAVSVPTACVLWGIMLSPDRGIVNSILLHIGFEQQPFLTSASQALASMVGIVAWKSIGYWALFFWAGLQEVPHSLYEASSLEGASRWKQFWHITYPMMKRPLTFVIVSVTTTNFLLFSPMYILTQGGPQNSTNTLMLESFNSAFLYSDLGRGSAIVIILLLLTSLVVAAQFAAFRAKH